MFYRTPANYSSGITFIKRVIWNSHLETVMSLLWTWIRFLPTGTAHSKQELPSIFRIFLIQCIYGKIVSRQDPVFLLTLHNMNKPRSYTLNWAAGQPSKNSIKFELLESLQLSFLFKISKKIYKFCCNLIININKNNNNNNNKITKKQRKLK